MLTELKSDILIDKFGGRFKLSALIQKRWRELMHGARPMVDPEGLSDLEVALREIFEGKIDIDESPEPQEQE